MQIIACTLRGVLSCHAISEMGKDGAFEIAPAWTTQVKGMEKVNALSVSSSHVSIGGFSQDGKGLVVLLSLEALHTENANRGD